MTQLHPPSSFLVSAFCLLAVIYFRRRRRRRPSAGCRHITPEGIRSLLSPPHTPHRLLLSRAMANARLVNAFGINSTFVSADTEIHRVFKSKAINLLNTAATDRQWMQLRELIETTVDAYISQDAADFDLTIRSITFVLVVIGLLNSSVSVDELDRNSIARVTENITKLWISSKSQHIPTTHPHLLTETNEILRRFFPDTDSYPNPIELIIPAWETTWRVVAIEIVHVYEDSRAQNVFSSFFNHPSTEQFQVFGTDGTASVQAHTMETLRLYPPTKHIGRTVLPLDAESSTWISRLWECLSGVGFGRSTIGTVAVADVEAVQRSVDIWGVDANEFHPERFDAASLTREQRGSMFVFGCPPLKCPAANWAPMAAGLIVAGILDSGCEVMREEEAQIGGREGWGGWKIRKKV